MDSTLIPTLEVYSGFRCTKHKRMLRPLGLLSSTFKVTIILRDREWEHWAYRYGSLRRIVGWSHIGECMWSFMSSAMNEKGKNFPFGLKSNPRSTTDWRAIYCSKVPVRLGQPTHSLGNGDVDIRKSSLPALEEDESSGRKKFYGSRKVSPFEELVKA